MEPATLKVIDVKKLDVQESNETVLDTTIQLLDGDTVLEERRLSFPLATTQEEMHDELLKVLATFNDDRRRAVQNEEHEAAQKQADETIAAVTGMTIEDPTSEALTPDSDATPANASLDSDEVAEDEVKE